MRTFLTTLIMASVFSTGLLTAQPCHDATGEFAALGTDAEFQEKHDEPVAINFKTKHGKAITYECKDGQEANAFLYEAPGNDYLFVIHEWWGLNDHIKKQAEKLFLDLGKQVNVICLDLYDGQSATTRGQASELMQNAKDERIKTVINGAFSFAGNDANIATIGWCFGGGWSLQAAIMAGENAIGCVMYYGMPGKDVERLAQLNSDLLGIFAKEDKWINPEVVATFEGNLEKAGIENRINSYEADHAFANPSNPNYNKKAANDAYAVTRDYLREKFK